MITEFKKKTSEIYKKFYRHWNKILPDTNNYSTKEVTDSQLKNRVSLI